MSQRAQSTRPLSSAPRASAKRCVSRYQREADADYRTQGEARSRQKTKAEKEADAEAAREASLATALPETNKGFKMMAKFGFKQGDTLGKAEDARKEPIRVDIKGDRSGIGLETKKGP